MTYFHRAGGGGMPPRPPGSATVSSISEAYGPLVSCLGCGMANEGGAFEIFTDGPQGKAMFSEASVCSQGGEGASASGGEGLHI